MKMLDENAEGDECQRAEHNEDEACQKCATQRMRQEEIEPKRTKNNRDRDQANHADHSIDHHTEQRGTLFRSGLPHCIVDFDDISTRGAEKEQIKESAN